MVMFDMSNWFYERGLEYLVTETVTTEVEDAALHRISASHREARAFDIRIKHLKAWQRRELQGYFNSKYKEIAAVTRSNHRPCLVVIHDSGKGIHAHVQIHSSFTVLKPLEHEDIPMYSLNTDSVKNDLND